MREVRALTFGTGGRARCATAVSLIGAVLLLLSGCSGRSTQIVSPTPSVTSDTTTAAPDPVTTDTGPAAHAMGRAVPIPGHIRFRQYQYTVAAGDTLIGIGERFRMCRDDFGILNSGFDAYNMPVGLKLTLGRVSDQPFTDACA